MNDGTLSVDDFVATSLTPSGIEVKYTVGPKIRKYEVRKGEHRFPVETCEACSAPWTEVPSVTTVLDVLAKGGLPTWGCKVGIAGALELHRQGVLRELVIPSEGMGQKVLAIPGKPGEGLVVAGVEQVYQAMKLAELTTDDVRDKAGSRGTAVHSALEYWCETLCFPDPEIFLPEEQGYVRGLLKFLKDLEPGEPEVLGFEVMVGSIEHGFAGRYDLELRLHKECVVQLTHIRKKWTLQPGDYLTDLKTSSDVYLSYFKQLEGYELGRIECGYKPTDVRAVIHVTPEGTYKFVPSHATGEDFLTTLAEWRSQERLTKRKAK